MCFVVNHLVGVVRVGLGQRDALANGDFVQSGRPDAAGPETEQEFCVNVAVQPWFSKGASPNKLSAKLSSGNT